jgi:uncharacterized protein YyaL (SSP411 family)
MEKPQGKSNRLSGEASPYLLQHAGNPVDWYPWCDEAFARAKRENKPVFLSIGYSACHWCHVMAHETFENTEIAAAMNENFVNIKVDREERPDIDHVYMQAVQALTGRGGWPLSVFLTPEGKPFFGGTYFPPQPQYGMPGFGYVLETVRQAFTDTRADIEQHAAELQQALSTGQKEAETGGIDAAVLDKAFEKMAADFDGSHGGFGAAPKFPEPMALEFLLRTYSRNRDNKALKMAEITLRKMASGGIYDQIGGGFHRYSTDNMWLVPHFEKMLYDNALLAGLYLHLYQVKGDPVYKDILCGTIDYLLREMKSGEGGFFSTQDADSDGAEGKYYIWDKEEFDQAAGEKDAASIGAYYNITDKGNFENKNILYIKDNSKLPDEKSLSDARAALARQRAKRTRPGTDEKIIASWNGMLLSSLSEAGAALGRTDYIQAAEECAAFIVNRMMPDGCLVHTYKDGKQGGNGFLEDYACVIQGLLDLYSATFDGKWLDMAAQLADKMIAVYLDKADGLLYDTPVESEKLFMRSRNLVDGATPSGCSSAVRSLLYLVRLTGNEHYLKVVEPALKSMQLQMSSYPRGFANWLCALDLYASSSLEVSIVCGNDVKEADSVKQAIHSVYLPNKVLAASCPGNTPGKTVPAMLEGKKPGGSKTAVYICIDNTCSEPISGISLLSKQLKDISSRTG